MVYDRSNHCRLLEKIAEGFHRLRNFPQCVGALDGKSILMKKGNFSMILMALVDYDYKFTYVQVGGDGCAHSVYT